MQTFTGIQYLQIDIANGFGLDHETWDNRLKWFEENEHRLADLIVEAKEPALFFKSITAYYDVMKGNPTGHLISLDATSSGLQILACLTGDRAAAELCNVVDTGDRQDAYTVIHSVMVEEAGEGSGITRDQSKQAIMTSLYGSTAMPKRIFGEGAMLKLYHDVMQALAPGAWELNEAFMSMWNPQALSHDWVMPDNFHVHTKVMDYETETVFIEGDPFEVSYKVNRPMEEGRSLGANTTHSIDGMIVREVTRRCDYDPKRIAQIREWVGGPQLFGNRAVTEDDKLVLTLWHHYKQSGYLSARILDHLHLENLGHVDLPVVQEMLSSLPEKPFKVISVHDCFRCLAHYGNDLRRQYNLQLALIARSNMLQYLISQIIGKPVQIDKLDRHLWQDIAQTNYALS